MYLRLFLIPTWLTFLTTDIQAGIVYRLAPEDEPARPRPEIRRKPLALLQLLGPLAFGQKEGGDVKTDVPMIGNVGMGDVTQTIAKFTPEGMENEASNGGTFAVDSNPRLGYMDRDTTLGKTSGSNSKMSIGGLGNIELGTGNEQGSGLLDFSKSLFPFLQLPPLKNDTSPDYTYSNVDPSLGDYFYPKPMSRITAGQMPTFKSKKADPVYFPFNTNNDEQNEPEAPLGGSQSLVPLSPSAVQVNKFPTMNEAKKHKSPFDRINNQPNYPLKMFAFKSTTGKKDDDMDLLGSAEQETNSGETGENDGKPANKQGFIPQKGKQTDVDEVDNAELLSAQHKIAQVTSRKSLKTLGLSPKEVDALCARFSHVANQHCYKPKVEAQFLDRCRGYLTDCAAYIAKSRPLGAVANSFSSGVGLTYYDWAVNGIPYYAVNEEGSIGNGHHGKIDFGSWGGGYSDNLGVRDYYSQTQEYGANWYEGTYGYKTGWSVPIAQSLGVEGGQGTQVSVPLKEGELGRPVTITNGYSVGPYVGLADRVGVDWLNGGVSFNRGFASPLLGVNVNSGAAVGFPSVGMIMQRMGLNSIDTLNAIAQQSAATTADAANNRGKFAADDGGRPPPIIADPGTHSILN